VAASWKLHLQPLDPGWIDLAFSVPLLDTTRARTELDWTPRVTATEALADVVAGMRDEGSTGSPVLRPRSLLDQLGRLVRSGPITRRREP
jgi:hypothetical protein